MKRQKYFLPLPIILLIVTFITFSATSTTAQTVFFHEDFETSPVTSIVNSNSGTLPDGPSPCGRASRGNTADFNSTHVHFDSTQDSTYFLGVNPESPCGGYYQATMVSDTFDLSSADSLYFKCRYFLGSGLNWGLTTISIVFSNDSTTYPLDTLTSPTNSWTTLEVPLPAYMKSPTVSMKMTFLAGNGVGLDDITIQNGKTGSCTETISTIDTTICGSYMSPSGKYTWTTNGTYNDTIPNAGGCDSVITIHLQVTSADTSVSQTDNTLTSHASMGTFKWLNCDNGLTPVSGATDSSFTPGANGNYSVEVTQNGCTDTSRCFSITGITSTGIQQLTSDNNPEIQIYPNPVKDVLYIAQKKNMNKTKLTIMDIYGRKIITQTIQLLRSAKTSINLGNLAPGSYILRFTDVKEGTTRFYKIIKE